MQIYTRRNAVIGWIVTRRTRRRLERRLNAIAGHRRHDRRRLAVGAGLAAGLAVAAGALVVVRRSTGQAQTA
ncbi:MAG TPA: hypothetical protein VHH57_02810 [Gaiella sp.]|jgi:hypothetical protein|nr:hypothetical protein [Gaiella sp.]